MFFITMVLCAYIFLQADTDFPKKHVLSLKGSFYCFLSTKRVFSIGLVMKIVVFLLVFCFKEGVQIGFFLLVGGPKDQKTYAWLTHWPDRALQEPFNGGLGIKSANYYGKHGIFSLLDMLLGYQKEVSALIWTCVPIRINTLNQNVHSLIGGSSFIDGSFVGHDLGTLLEKTIL